MRSAVRRRPRLKGLTPAGRLWKHSTLADIEGVVAREEFGRLLIVTLTRNPWDRVVSYWSWLRAQSFAHPAVGLARASTFTASGACSTSAGGVLGWRPGMGRTQALQRTAAAR